jgi:hypothetical protein
MDAARVASSLTVRVEAAKEERRLTDEGQAPHRSGQQ